MHNVHGPYSTAPPVAEQRGADAVDELVDVVPSSSAGSGPLGIENAA